ncbi:hypothetical protein [Microcoleus anatoxicus]
MNLSQECDRVIPFGAITCPIYRVEGDNDYRLPKVIVQNRLPFTYA